MITENASARIELIKNYQAAASKSNLHTPAFQALLEYGVGSILLLLVISVSANKLWDTDFGNLKWQNAGITIVMSMAIAFRSPFFYIDWVLTKHLEKLVEGKLQVTEKQNEVLSGCLQNLKKQRKQLWIYGLPMSLVLLAAFLQVFGKNPYWNQLPAVVLLVTVYSFIRIQYLAFYFKRKLKVNENLNK